MGVDDELDPRTLGRMIERHQQLLARDAEHARARIAPERREGNLMDHALALVHVPHARDPPAAAQRLVRAAERMQDLGAVVPEPDARAERADLPRALVDADRPSMLREPRRDRQPHEPRAHDLGMHGHVAISPG